MCYEGRARRPIRIAQRQARRSKGFRRAARAGRRNRSSPTGARDGEPRTEGLHPLYLNHHNVIHEAKPNHGHRTVPEQRAECRAVWHGNNFLRRLRLTARRDCSGPEARLSIRPGNALLSSPRAAARPGSRHGASALAEGKHLGLPAEKRILRADSHACQLRPLFLSYGQKKSDMDKWVNTTPYGIVLHTIISLEASS